MDNDAQDTDFHEALEHFLRAGMPDPVFRRAMLLARRKGLDVAGTLRLLHAFTSPAGEIRWERLGNPSVRMCREISACVKQGRDALERSLGARTDSCAPAGMNVDSIPGLLVYALLQEFLPCTFDEAVATLGTELALERLHRFARIVDSVSIVG